MISINPFELLGVTVNSTISELKKSYYSLSLLCHPDKGGNADDMNTLAMSYKYLCDQLEHKTEKTYEEIEAEFEAFCAEQQETPPPDFAEIYGDAVEGFNREFDAAATATATATATANPFGREYGYGELMETSERNDADDGDGDATAVLKNTFSQEIQIYKEPAYCPGYIADHMPLDGEKITDFSGKYMCDYYRAHTAAEAKAEAEAEAEAEAADVNSAYEQRLKERNIPF
jgi:curved DNA-binding protein CbpA